MEYFRLQAEALAEKTAGASGEETAGVSGEEMAVLMEVDSEVNYNNNL